MSGANFSQELNELENERSKLQISDESTIRDYYELRQQLSSYTKDMRDVINHPNYSLQFMQPGRLVSVKYMDHDFGWGAVVNYNQRRPGRGQRAEDFTPQESYVIDVLLHVSDASPAGMPNNPNLPPGVTPPAKGQKGRMEVVPVLLSCIESIGHIRLFLPKDLKSADQRNTVRKSLEEVKKRFPDGIAILDPIENMGITDDSFKKLLRVSKVISSASDLLLMKPRRKSKCWSQGYYPTHFTILHVCLPCMMNTRTN